MLTVIVIGLLVAAGGDAIVRKVRASSKPGRVI